MHSQCRNLAGVAEMSISSWKEEFYIPVWNVPEGDESAAIAQSLQKFRGLRQEVLAKHGLTRIGSEGRMYPKIGELGGPGST